jgi:hypothetical protein
MVATDVKETRRQLNELAETQHWVHHVADLDSGKILTFPLDRPVTPLSRAERLSRLGHSFDPSILGNLRWAVLLTQPEPPSQRFAPGWAEC